MTDRFLHMMPYLIGYGSTKDNGVEGGMDRDRNDPGNYVNGTLVGTKYGIDAASHPKEDIKNLTKDQARDIFWEDYWTENRCDDLPFPFGEAFFDVCVNNGRGRADQLLKLSRDTSGFLNARDAFYRRLAAKRPKSRGFLQGWLDRDNILRKYLGVK